MPGGFSLADQMNDQKLWLVVGKVLDAREFLLTQYDLNMKARRREESDLVGGGNAKRLV